MEEFKKDPRTACKYGSRCYQKNPDHKTKFKHPPKEDQNDCDVKQDKKRPKLGETCLNTENPSSSHEESVPTEAVESVATSKEKVSEEPIKKLANNGEPPKFLGQSDNEIEDESEDEDQDEELPPGPSDVKLSMKQKFLVDMPNDFYSFWEFCKSLCKDKPEKALKDVGLLLVGPYEELSGKISRSSKRKTQSRFLRHWRYYYDPPEFQTVLTRDDKSLYHIGYFRDDPKEMPCFLAYNCALEDGTLHQMGPNIFSAVHVFLEKLKTNSDPFAKIKVSKILKSLEAWAEKEGYSLDCTTPELKQRTRNAVCKTFHGAGLVVPYNKKSDVGYRPLIESNVNLKRILNKVRSAKDVGAREDALESLQPIINAANIANDECDFGTSVELGLDLFFYGGKELGKEALQLLTTGYSLLNRKEFAEIAKAHIQHRKRGADVDMFP